MCYLILLNKDVHYRIMTSVQESARYALASRHAEKRTEDQPWDMFAVGYGAAYTHIEELFALAEAWSEKPEPKRYILNEVASLIWFATYRPDEAPFDSDVNEIVDVLEFYYRFWMIIPKEEQITLPTVHDRSTFKELLNVFYLETGTDDAKAVYRRGFYAGIMQRMEDKVESLESI